MINALMSSACPPEKILNPKTGRCVKINGKIRQSIILAMQQQQKKHGKKIVTLEQQQKPPRDEASNFEVGIKKKGRDGRGFWKVVLTDNKQLVWEPCGVNGVPCAKGD